jgi:hypothetical protein
VKPNKRTAMGVTRLAAADLAELEPYCFESSTPLWYCVLKEAQLVADGLHLGPVGGRIVGEVLIGLPQTDPATYLVQKPRWDANLAERGLRLPHQRFPDLRGRRSGKPARRSADLRLVVRAVAQPRAA